MIDPDRPAKSVRSFLLGAIYGALDRPGFMLRIRDTETSFGLDGDEEIEGVVLTTESGLRFAIKVEYLGKAP